MAKQINKAYIKFKLNKEDAEYTQIRFHSVIFEDHEVKNDITKFPVQSGFDISNHSIKRNRKVSLNAIITDTQMLLSSQFFEYSATSNSKAVYDVLKQLVRKAIPCIVVTNLTEYDPVLFTHFKTKQEAGMTDAINFTIQGEEVQLATTTNGTTPTELVLTPVPTEERAAKLEELRQAGYDVAEEAGISIANVDLKDGWAMSTTTPAGIPSKITYEPSVLDDATTEYSYECSITPDGTVTDEFSGEVLASGGEFSSRLQNGANVFGACLVESAVSEGTALVEDTITTAVGDLKKTVYGGLYEILGVNGNRSFGQKLLAMGLDCFIVGATATQRSDDGGFLVVEDDFDTDLPTVDDALKGAARHGDGLATDGLSQASPTTITKLSGSSVGTTSFFGDLL